MATTGVSALTGSRSARFTRCGAIIMRAARRIDQRVAVGIRARHRLEPDVAVAAGAVLDDERLPERLGEAGAEEARRDVGDAARGDVDDHPHRLRRPLLCRCRARECRQCGAAMASLLMVVLLRWIRSRTLRHRLALVQMVRGRARRSAGAALPRLAIAGATADRRPGSRSRRRRRSAIPCVGFGRGAAIHQRSDAEYTKKMYRAITPGSSRERIRRCLLRGAQPGPPGRR